MVPSADFEAGLRAFTSAPVASAAGAPAQAAAPDDAGDSVASQLKQWLDTEPSSPDALLLRDALDRLAADPHLFGGDPNDVYTFEDPVLAVAADFVRRAVAAPVAEAADGAKLRNRNWIRWAIAGVHAWRSRGDTAWASLGGLTPSKALTVPELPARIAVLGDAGFDCTAQSRVLAAIGERHRAAPFQLGVHLGDTYFAGSAAEVVTNLLKPLASLDFPFTSLCGNHDLYYGPSGYAATVAILRQPGRYFAIEAPGWRIACLDTSLACERLLRNDGKLDDGQLAWLDGLLHDDDGRRLVLMSHHYVVSDWGGPIASLHAQMRDRLRGQVLAWYWGHEHSLVAYPKNQMGFFGACVGNGAFLEKRTPASSSQPAAEWVAPGECDCYSNRAGFWPHGWLELELRADRIEETYHLEGRPAIHRRTLMR